MQQIKLSIGIPAFNEEATIQKLLNSIFAQKMVNYSLLEVIVVSDGSTDQTVQKVKEIKNKKIMVINGTKRLGKTSRLNQIFNSFKGDVLLLMDGDIELPENNILNDIFKKLNVSKNELATIEARNKSGTTIIEKCINYSILLQNEIRRHWNKGDNYLSFKGCFLILSRNFAKSISLNKSIVNNDAYLYFLAKNNNIKPLYLHKYFIYFKSPSTFYDHLLQSSRYKSSVNEMQKYFGLDTQLHYKIPRLLFFATSVKYLFKNPLLFIGYSMIQLLVISRKIKKQQSIWEIANSTKNQIQIKNQYISKTIMKIRKTTYVTLYSLDRLLNRNNSVFVLCYHDIENDNWRFSIDMKEIEKQIKFLAKHYKFITLKDIEAHIAGIKVITKPSVVITFDDGYKNVMKLRHLFKNHVKPTLFVLSENKNADRGQISKTSALLTKKDLLLLRKEGWTIGSHSATHADFSALTKGDITKQVIKSKKQLEKNLGVKIDYFAYPKGKYNSDILNAVKKAKYQLGLSMDDGSISNSTNLYTIPRVGIDRSHTFNEFKATYSPSVIRTRQFIKTHLKGVSNAAIS